MSMSVNFESAVSAAISHADLGAIDQAAVHLAMEYAYRIDESGELDRYGPKLLSALAELGLTPKARSAVMKKGVEPDEPSTSTVENLRSRRRNR